jgi:hypothetical protein
MEIRIMAERWNEGKEQRKTGRKEDRQRERGGEEQLGSKEVLLSSVSLWKLLYYPLVIITVSLFRLLLCWE